jgi:hypothetical protein
MDLRQKELDRIPKEKRTTDDEIRWGNAKDDLACERMQLGCYGKAKDILEELLGGIVNGDPRTSTHGYCKYYSYSGYILMARANRMQPSSPRERV